MTKLDFRELLESDEEAMLAFLDYVRSLSIATHPVKVVEDTKEGKDVKLQPMVKKSRMKEDGKVETYDMTTLDEVPIRYQRGGGVVQTHPVKKDDIGYWVPFARDVQTVRKKDGVQDPSTTRINSFSDGYFTSGFRPDPQHEKVMGKDAKRFSKDTHQLRSDDGRHTADLHPGDPTGKDKEKKKKGGFIHKSVHPDDTTKAEGNPFADAKKFASHTNVGNVGVTTTLMEKKGDKEDKDHKHEIKSDYKGHKVETGNKEGPRNHYIDLHEDDDKAYKMSVKKDQHYHSCTKAGGHKVSCDKDDHYLELKPGNSATLHSKTEVKLNCPDGKCKSNTPEHEFSKDIKVTDTVNCKKTTASEKVEAPLVQGTQGLFGSMGGIGGGSMGGNSPGGNAGSGGVGSGGMAENAASYNVGTLGGDLYGTLPNPQVVRLTKTLVNAANDSAAATAGVEVNEIYRNGSVLMVRVT